MFRRTAFEQVGGFRDSLIAGEEPELCLRLRSAGWRIWRVDREMTLHDAAILRWTQWFRRARRTGHAFAEGAALHGATPERHWVRETRRALLWGFALPLAILLLAVFWDLKAVGLFLVFPLQVARLAVRRVRPGTPRWTAALLLVLARFPEAVGVFDYWSRRLAGRRATLIEYK